MLRITPTLQKILAKIFGLFCKLVYFCIDERETTRGLPFE